MMKGLTFVAGSAAALVFGATGLMTGCEDDTQGPDLPPPPTMEEQDQQPTPPPVQEQPEQEDLPELPPMPEPEGDASDGATY